ncbi:hypothetical protein WJX74_001278 [Apatococcus lobatus]|uniref:DUF4385 domain-containing protein n=1 Tax=Apatococcus lobatus TaxID=904363 RepID=A0AAW1S4L7_9CHLO
MPKFNYDLDFKTVNFREQPELYQVGKGEQGVLSVEPYKSELLPHWKFKDPETASASSETLFNKFKEYKSANDFVGMDMARKFLQMGHTRSRRYANHRSGRKYDKDGKVAERVLDPVKAECAEIFRTKLELAKADGTYQDLKAEHLQKYS